MMVSEVKSKLLSRVWLFETPWALQSWNSPGHNTGVGNLSLLQGIFPTQGSNPGLPHCKWILYQLSNQGSLLVNGMPKNRLSYLFLKNLFGTDIFSSSF